MSSAETEEGIAQAIVYGHIDFKRDPWPKVSEEAKELVKGMLDPTPFSRLTVDQVLGTFRHRLLFLYHEFRNGENFKLTFDFIDTSDLKLAMRIKDQTISKF